MRQFFSLRFVATLIALALLAGGTVWLVRDRSSAADHSAVDIGGSTTDRTVDLVALVDRIVPADGFGFRDGVTTADLALRLDATRTMVVKAGTPGEATCKGLVDGVPTAKAHCVVAADLLGDGVLWFSLVDGTPGTVALLPGIVELIDTQWVRLGNGWVVQRANLVDRSCADDTSSLSNFVSTYADRATATFDLTSQRVVRVTCPAAGATTTGSTTTGSTTTGSTTTGSTTTGSTTTGSTTTRGG